MKTFGFRRSSKPKITGSNPVTCFSVEVAQLVVATD